MPARRRPGRLLLTIHHLAVDGVSWRILVPDLAAAWAAIARGEEPALAPRGTSFRRLGAAACGAGAGCADAVEELAFWSGMLSAPSLSLVEGALDPGARRQRHGRASDADAAGCADGSAADAGAGGVPRRHQRCAADRPGAGGCGLVPAAWPRRSGHAVLLDLEGHGREEVFADVDLSRTVGWFTSLFPVRLDPGALDLEEALAGGAALGRALKRIKEQLRALPDNGLGYGLLRYLNAQTAPQLARLCGAADRLQLSRAVCGCGGGGLGRGAARRCGLARRRSGDAAGALRSRSMR